MNDKRNAKVNTNDGDSVTKLQNQSGWKQGAPVFSPNSPPIKIKNDQILVVDDSSIKNYEGKEYYLISRGEHQGKFVKKIDVSLQ